MNFVSIATTQSSIELVDSFGKITTLTRGEYCAEAIENIKSVKVAAFTKVTFYENIDAVGQHYMLDKDCPQFSLTFVPQLIVVESYAQAVQLNGTIDCLSEGEYIVSELKKYEKLILPRGFYAVFAGNIVNEHTVRIFENEHCIIDSRVDEYEKVLLFTLGANDIRINFGIKEELGDDELMGIAGGKCNVHAVDACTYFCPCHIKA